MQFPLNKLHHRHQHHHHHHHQLLASWSSCWLKRNRMICNRTGTIRIRTKGNARAACVDFTAQRTPRQDNCINVYKFIFANLTCQYIHSHSQSRKGNHFLLQHKEKTRNSRKISNLRHNQCQNPATETMLTRFQVKMKIKVSSFKADK